MAVVSRVLLLLDGSEFSERALALLGAVPAGAELTLFHVSGQKDEGERYLAGVASGLGRDAATIVRAADDPAAAVLEEVTQGQHDLIVMMTRGHEGLTKLVYGSVAEQLVRQAPVPLLLGNGLREKGPLSLSKVLIAVDDSPVSDSLLEWIPPYVRAFGAEALLFTAVMREPGKFADEEAKSLVRGEAALMPRLQQLKKTGVNARSVIKTMSNTAEVIVEAATDEGADLIAMATHGRSGVSSWLQSSVAETVLRTSPLPVLLMRAQTE